MKTYSGGSPSTLSNGRRRLSPRARKPKFYFTFQRFCLYNTNITFFLSSNFSQRNIPISSRYSDDIPFVVPFISVFCITNWDMRNALQWIITNLYMYVQQLCIKYIVLVVKRILSFKNNWIWSWCYRWCSKLNIDVSVCFMFSMKFFLHISIGRHRDIDIYLLNVCVFCIALMYNCVFLDTPANKLMASFKQTVL
jgi:hypothetical protein